MYLQTKDISIYTKTTDRMKNGRHYRNFQEELAGLQLQQFTVQKSAMETSASNLESILERAGNIGIPTVIVTPSDLQFIGQKDVCTDELVTDDQIKKLDQGDKEHWSASRWHIEWSSDRFECLELQGAYDTYFILKKESGFYQFDGEKYNKIKNRYDQINTLWNYGFASRRGRPCRVGRISQSGTKSEIEQLVRWYETLGRKKSGSDVHGKVNQIYNSLNRSYAWPEHW